jgi:hypothetical protein
MSSLPADLSAGQSIAEVSPNVVAPDAVLTMAVWVQGIPAAVYLFGRRRGNPTGYAALGGLLTLLSTSIGTIIAREAGNNYIVGYLFIPLIAAAYILALAEWQVTYFERVMFRVGYGLFAAIYIVLAAFFENVTHFGQYSHTLYSLVLLSGSLWTLGRRSFEQSEGLALETDWFWVAFGLAVYAAATASTAALGNILMARDRVDLFLKVWSLRAAFVILAFLAISWGVYRGPVRAAPLATAP